MVRVTYGGGFDWATLGSLLTAVATLGLLGAATLAWRAAQAQVRVLKDAMKSASRPLLVIEHGTSRLEGAQFSAPIRNVGLGPAVNVTGEVRVFPFGDWQDCLNTDRAGAMARMHDAQQPDFEFELVGLGANRDVNPWLRCASAAAAEPGSRYAVLVEFTYSGMLAMQGPYAYMGLEAPLMATASAATNAVV